MASLRDRYWEAAQKQKQARLRQAEAEAALALAQTEQQAQAFDDSRRALTGKATQAQTAQAEYLAARGLGGATNAMPTSGYAQKRQSDAANVFRDEAARSLSTQARQTQQEYDAMRLALMQGREAADAEADALMLQGMQAQSALEQGQAELAFKRAQVEQAQRNWETEQAAKQRQRDLDMAAAQREADTAAAWRIVRALGYVPSQAVAELLGIDVGTRVR